MIEKINTRQDEFIATQAKKMTQKQCKDHQRKRDSILMGMTKAIKILIVN